MCVVAGGNDDMIQYQKMFYGQSVMSKDDVNRRHNNQIIYNNIVSLPPYSDTLVRFVFIFIVYTFMYII